MSALTTFCQSFDQLPPSIPVFPLDGAIVVPRGMLPLHIFEPRYVHMVQDAMRSNQLIGMIQPADDQATPSLHSVGCAARIVRYEEMHNSRLGILVLGLCRFKVAQELDSVRGYRVVVPEWSPYKNDYDKTEQLEKASMHRMIELAKTFLEGKMQVDWSVINDMSSEEVVNNAAIYLPLNSEEKQFLLEAQTLGERLAMLIALMESVTQQTNKKH